MKEDLTDKIIFKKFRVGKSIYSSNLAFIHEGINGLNKEKVAMKFEKISAKYNLLEYEAYLIYQLQGMGIPKIISYGKSWGYNVLIEELLGQSIESIWKTKNKDIKPNLNDVCLIAIQCLDRLEYIHSKNIIHRDIKPLNFLIGRKDPNIIYLIDFGISKKYRSSKTGKHIKFSCSDTISGSLRYMSINASKGYAQSRRDDLESLGYMLVFLIKMDLPWLCVEKLKLKKEEKNARMLCLKIDILPENMCSGIPKEFCEYIKYCRKLSFEQAPNYNYLRHLFLDIIKNKGNFHDYKLINFMKFSWIKPDRKIRTIEPSPTIKQIKSLTNKNSAISKGKKDTHKRLFGIIKNCIEITKSVELPSIEEKKLIKFDLKNRNKKQLNVNSNGSEPNYLLKKVKKKLNGNNIISLPNYSFFNYNSSPINKDKIINPEISKKKIPSYYGKNTFKPTKKYKQKKIIIKTIGNKYSTNTFKKNLTRHNSFKIDSINTSLDKSEISEFSRNLYKVFRYKTLEERENEKSKKNKTKNKIIKKNNGLNYGPNLQINKTLRIFQGISKNNKKIYQKKTNYNH